MRIFSCEFTIKAKVRDIPLNEESARIKIKALFGLSH